MPFIMVIFAKHRAHGSKASAAEKCVCGPLKRAICLTFVGRPLCLGGMCTYNARGAHCIRVCIEERPCNAPMSVNQVVLPQGGPVLGSAMPLQQMGPLLWKTAPGPLEPMPDELLVLKSKIWVQHIPPSVTAGAVSFTCVWKKRHDGSSGFISPLFFCFHESNGELNSDAFDGDRRWYDVQLMNHPCPVPGTTYQCHKTQCSSARATVSSAARPMQCVTPCYNTARYCR